MGDTFYELPDTWSQAKYPGGDGWLDAGGDCLRRLSVTEWLETPVVPPPVVTGYKMGDDTIRTTVTAWLSDRYAAERTYGLISTWDTLLVTDMSELFLGASSFDEAIGLWDTSRVTTMKSMFQDASAFNRRIYGWSVGEGINIIGMFDGASSFNQNLGWCVDTDISSSFTSAACNRSSPPCGVTQGNCQ